MDVTVLNTCTLAIVRSASKGNFGQAYVHITDPKFTSSTTGMSTITCTQFVSVSSSIDRGLSALQKEFNEILPSELSISN